MKVKEKIYMPYRLIKVRATGKLEKQFCLDSKRNPRLYSSIETLEEYMPEEYDGVAVFKLKNFQVIGKPIKHKTSKKMKRIIKRLLDEDQELEEYLRFHFYRGLPTKYRLEW